MEQHYVKGAVTPARRKRILFAGSVLVVLVIGSAGLVYHKLSEKPVVPKNISRQLSFPVYYPDPKKLPAGYTLDTASFTSPEQGVVLYAVNYHGGKLVFSLQQKPSSADLEAFNQQRIPIHIEFTTKLGKAELGIIGNQAVVSLPTKDNLWIIVTGPQVLRERDIAPVIASLRR